MDDRLQWIAKQISDRKDPAEVRTFSFSFLCALFPCFFTLFLSVSCLVGAGEMQRACSLSLPFLSLCVCPFPENQTRTRTQTMTCTPQFLLRSEERVLYEGYLEEMRVMEALDFSCMISKTVHLLEKNDRLRVFLATSLRHILVDEVPFFFPSLFFLFFFFLFCFCADHNPSPLSLFFLVTAVSGHFSPAI